MAIVEIIQVDFNDQKQASDLCRLLNGYAVDPQGGGQAIDEARLSVLPKRLSEFSGAVSFLVYVDKSPAALANCFFGFSTFAAQQLLNIHDLAVEPSFRGQGLSIQLLSHIEAFAMENDCCKLTLEVLDKNTVAQNAYRKFGFESYELDSDTGQALFWQKKLT